MQRPYLRRRERFLHSIGSAVALLPSAPTALRNNDVEHPYRQDSDFYYLTGFREPESVAVLGAGNGQPFVMFVRPRDKDKETWHGRRLGVEGATAELGANAAHPIEELAQKLPELLQGRQRLVYRLGRDRKLDDLVLSVIDRLRAGSRRGSSWPTEIVDPSTVLHEMRLIKGPDEIALIERAVAITSEAFGEIMRAAEPGKYEYELEALLTSVFRRHGSERVAYEPIVGSGANATILHYRENDRRIDDRDLLLVDAGCEYGYYAADITRTFPVSGRFSTPQRALYDIVLEAQLAAIAAVRPSATLDHVHDAALHVIARGLIDLGIVDGSLEQVLAEELYKPYFMHRTSHFLGMDVHDVGAYYVDGSPRPLEPSMVITVEPGIYVARDADAPESYRGIGIRIEDDVLVTSDGSRVLTVAVPKRADDVERACRA